MNTESKIQYSICVFVLVIILSLLSWLILSPKPIVDYSLDGYEQSSIYIRVHIDNWPDSSIQTIGYSMENILIHLKELKSTLPNHD